VSWLQLVTALVAEALLMPSFTWNVTKLVEIAGNRMYKDTPALHILKIGIHFDK